MTSIDQRGRIARALSEADISGPDDFDTADEMERRMYDRMALAALNSAHLYAIHTVLMPEVFMALAEVAVHDMTITIGTDEYRVWGEEAQDGEARHIIIGTSNPATVAAIGRAFEEWGVFGDLTDHSDWAEPAVGADYVFRRTWNDWVRISDYPRNG